MTKDQLVFYLRVCADLADGPADQVAYVKVDCLRQAIELLESADEPEANSTPLERAFAKEPERSIVDRALRQIGTITWSCTVCGTKDTVSPCEHVRFL